MPMMSWQDMRTDAELFRAFMVRDRLTGERIEAVEFVADVAIDGRHLPTGSLAICRPVPPECENVKCEDCGEQATWRFTFFPPEYAKAFHVLYLPIT